MASGEKKEEKKGRGGEKEAFLVAQNPPLNEEKPGRSQCQKKRGSNERKRKRRYQMRSPVFAPENWWGKGGKASAKKKPSLRKKLKISAGKKGLEKKDIAWE